MAVLWQKKTNGMHYEVRTAGQTRRLYTNGVLHSQFNPYRPLTGGVWDLLMLPAFFFPRGRIQRILVLGVGGGAVIQLLRHLEKPTEVVGVELNPVHLRIAKRFFGVDSKVASLYQADAVEWIRDYGGPPFDMIIDDLFGDCGGEPIRAVPPNAAWFDVLDKHLTRSGLVVMNFVCSRTLRDCAYFSSRRIAHRFASVFQLTLPLYENLVGAFLKTESSSRILRKNLIATPGLDHACGPNRLAYRIRRIG